jgi:DNA-directed RNA polymerase beta' subunit
MELRDLDYIQFGIYSSEEIVKNSVCEIHNVKLTGPHSVYDERMGIMEANKKCVTCGQNEKKCIGHFGHIVLNIDVLHPLFNKLTMLILKCICYKCSRVLLSKEQLELNNLLKYQKQTRFNKIVEKMDKIDYCTHCETIQPRYLFCTQDKHFYMIFKMDGENMRMQMFESEIRKIFENVICDDIILLGFDPANFHPKNLVLNVLPVIPPVARPFIIAENMTCDDDLTIQYQEIVKANFHIGDPNTNDSKRTKFTHALKFRIKSLFDNSGDRQRVSNGRPLKGIKKRLTGKEGLIRNNLMGKRVDKSARTVIGPDPTLNVDEIAIPQEIADILCYPVRVTDNNKSSLEKMIHDGKVNFILKDDGNIRINIKYATMKQGTRLHYGDVIQNKKELRIIKKESDIFSLKPGDKVYRNGKLVENTVSNTFKPYEIKKGDVVERKLFDGDILLLNRQPTLHRGSMIAQKIKIRPGKTIRLNLAITKSFNADFDGDEMNLHCPATPETEAELRILSCLQQNIISNQSSKANIVIVQDSLLGAYLMTIKRTPPIPRHQFFNIAYSLNKVTLDNLFTKVNLYRKKKSIKDPNYYDGRMLFSLILPDNFFLEEHNKTDKDEPILKIHQGILLEGAIGKSNLSSGSNSIITLLYHEYGEMRCSQFLNEVQFLTNNFLLWHGFSIGVGDCKVTKKDEIQNNISKAFIKAKSIEEHTQDPHLREVYILYALSGARDTGMSIAQKALKEDNNFLATVISGAKGDYFNIAQITGLLGQQNLNGERIQPILTNFTRTLPHYPIEKEQYTEDMQFESSGFIRSSFIYGLNPREYFFHAMTGREGITDTAMKSVTGDSRILILCDGLPQIVEIGPWIDELLRSQSNEVIHYQEKSMELLHLFEDVYIPTTDDFGNITWGNVSAVTRHDPGEELFEIKTKSGRSVIVTESKSLIIWKEEKQIWEEVPTLEVIIGDKVPVTLSLPDHPHSVETLAKSNFEFCYNNGVFLGLYFAENPNKYLTASQLKLFQEWMPLKQVPNECFTANLNFVKGILSSYFAMDGGYMEDKFGVQSESKILLEGIALLCSRFDIFTHWGENKNKFVLYIDNYTLDFVNDTVLDPIVEMNKVDVSKYPKVYDLTVPSTLNFALANGLHVRDTATSGYIQRRMIKIAEDIQVKYDGTVRNSANSIIQMSYGDNFLDPTKTVFMKSKPLPCNISRIIQKINFSHEQKSH